MPPLIKKIGAVLPLISACFFSMADAQLEGEIRKPVNGGKIIHYHCGACHIQSLPTAQQGALKIFDLEQNLWASKLTDSQRKKIVTNLESRMKMTQLEISYLMPPNYQPLPKPPNREDIEAVKKFLKEEKERKYQLSEMFSL